MPTNDWGIRLSQFGYDVKTASDSQLIFSSSWPLLKIHAQQSFSVPTTGLDTTVYTHNLGYPPLVLVVDNTTYSSRLFGPDTGLIKVDNTKVQVNLNAANVTVPFTGYVYLFRHSLEQNYQAPIINTIAGVFNSQHDWGLKISKVGKSISSVDFRDFVIHSSTRSPMIQNITWGPLAFNGVDYSLTATHNLTYNPWFLAFIKRSGNAFYEGYFGGSGSDVLLASSTTVKMKATTSGQTGSIFTFKDPFQL